MDKFDIIMGVFMAVIFIMLGWFANVVYYAYFDYQREFNGLYISNAQNYSKVKEITKSYESEGDWVCINVRNMEYPEAYDTCVHECSHRAYSEIFAEKCERDIENCMEVIK